MAIPKELKGDVLVFDTETAVLGDHICEVGFSHFKDCKLHREWGTLVRPLVPIEPDASNVHKIYDTDVENSPTFAEIAWFLYNYFNSVDVHVAYNYEYDRRVFENEFTRIGMTFPIKPMVDPFILYKLWHKYAKGKTLIKAAEMYGIPFVGAHRAVNDSTVTGKLLFKMAATKTAFPKNLKILLQKQRVWVEEQFIDLRDYFVSKGRDEPDEPVYKFYEHTL